MGKREELERTRDTLKRYGLPHKDVNKELNKLKSDDEIRDDIRTREEDGLCADDLRDEYNSRDR